MANEDNAVDQELMASEYFSEFEPVDDDINDDVIDDGKGVDGGGEKKQQSQAIDDSKKQDITPEGGKGTGNASPNEFQIPKGFGEHWYNKGEDGNVTFNTDEALSFFTPKEGYEGFKSPEIKFADPVNPGADPPKDEYEQYFEDEQKRQTNMRENMFMWRDVYNQAVEKGYEPSMAGAYADKVVNGILSKDIQSTSIRYNADMRRRNDERIAQIEEKNEIKSRVATNENYFVNYFGGGQKGSDIYNQLMVTAYPYLQHMCERANPGCFEGKTKEEVNKTITEYYNKTASNVNSLSMLVELAMNKIFRSHAKNMIERGVRAGPDGKPVGGPSGLNPAPAPSSQGQNSLNTYLEQV